jgi:hypothetical protein
MRAVTAVEFAIGQIADMAKAHEESLFLNFQDLLHHG